LTKSRRSWRICGPNRSRCGGIFDVDRRRKELTALEVACAAPGFWDSQNQAKATIDKANQHRAVLKPLGELDAALQDAAVLAELAEAESDSAQRDHALAEAAGCLAKAEELSHRLEMQSLLGDRLDGNNAYLTFHAGAGGTESCDWAEMLLRMYRRYLETRGFEIEVLDYQPGEEAGIRSVSMLVSGAYAYGYTKAERGVHRLVRISPFDANKRRHTSFASLDVVAEISDDIEVEIKESDLRVDTYRSSGAGGQHVNKTDSAIRLTHIPTGLVVACQAERSQHKNRSKAFSMLRARLYELKQDEQRKDMEKFYGEKGEIAWGSQIRSYVLQPYTLVKDHRTEYETSNVNAVLDGEIQGFVEAYLKRQVEERNRRRAANG
jgi:peptide chain release factor 2